MGIETFHRIETRDPTIEIECSHVPVDSDVYDDIRETGARVRRMLLSGKWKYRITGSLSEIRDVRSILISENLGGEMEAHQGRHRFYTNIENGVAKSQRVRRNLDDIIDWRYTMFRRMDGIIADLEVFHDLSSETWAKGRQ